MAVTSELFRFVTLRPANRVLMNRIESRLIRDRRASAPLLETLFGPGEFEAKLSAANAFALSADFIDDGDDGMRALEPVVDFFRAELLPERPLDELTGPFSVAFPILARLLKKVPPADLVESTSRSLGGMWDSLYTQVTRGCDRFVSTNYLVDGLRVYHLLGLLWLSGKLELATWTGARFDEYHPIINLQAAAAASSTRREAEPPAAAAGPGRGRATTAPSTPPSPIPSTPSNPPTTPSASLAGGLGVFRVPLTVGEMKPPTVGDLILVEQELRRYEAKELAAIETVMKGERREHTTRNLARTTETTTSETSSEQEETSSITIDERFQLSAQSQSTASQSFGVQTGVSVSGKYGPVQVGATVNASFDTSQSTTDSNAQEYAKSVTEEATKRVSNSFKESSSITILTETQDTTLQGFNNEGGTVHINGMYCWLDKVYEAKLLNYGRRLMLTLNVPEPAAYYRGLLQQNEDLVLSDLVPPVHPTGINRGLNIPRGEFSQPEDGYRSYQDITEDNYAGLAALYGVTNIQPPMPLDLTGSKAIVIPDAMQPTEIDNGDVGALTLLMADSSLSVDPDYRIVRLGVYAADGQAEDFRDYADLMLLGEKNEEIDKVLVTVGVDDFYLEVTGNGKKNPKGINTNFNTMEEVREWEKFGSVVQPTIPVTVSASFSGLLNLTVVYDAVRRDEALDRWKAATYAAVLKGYDALKGAYDQALALAKAKARSETESQTFLLREDQYRAIELTELKRSCIDLISEGTAAGHPSISIAEDGVPTIVYHEADAADLPDWRSPLSNGTVADFFEQVFDWDQTTYNFYPYYWAGKERWAATAQAAGADPIFESFLRAGSASVVVPVRPGFERPAIFFLKTGLIWGGRYMPLFTSPEMLAVYAEVELDTQMDPPEQIGETWEIRLPTSLVMLQESDELPEFPADVPEETPEPLPEPVLDESAPF